jgi:enoyl-CoA hydratase/carnithine racemase
MVTGTRYAAPAALAAGAVDAIAAQDDVLAVAVEAAQRQAGKNRDTLRAIKAGLYADAEQALRSLQSAKLAP